jgi:hypothetical protein
LPEYRLYGRFESTRAAIIPLTVARNADICGSTRTSQRIVRHFSGCTVPSMVHENETKCPAVLFAKRMCALHGWTVLLIMSTEYNELVFDLIAAVLLSNDDDEARRSFIHPPPRVRG